MLACSCGCGCGSEPASDRINIAVIPKGTSHVFWQSVHAGARQAAQELDVDIAWRGPLREDDRDSQVAEVENAVARRVSGIALAPLDEAALVAPVTSAQRSGVPVVIFDSGLKGGEIVSFVATDNDKGGELAGEHLAKVAGRQGEGDPDALRRRPRQHAAARRGISARPGARTRRSRSSAAISMSAPMSKAPTSAPKRCSRSTRPPTARSASTACLRRTNPARSR